MFYQVSKSPSDPWLLLGEQSRDNIPGSGISEIESIMTEYPFLLLAVGTVLVNNFIC